MTSSEPTRTEVRKWAKANEISVPSSGPIPDDVLARYKEAMVADPSSDDGDAVDVSPVFSAAEDPSDAPVTTETPEDSTPVTESAPLVDLPPVQVSGTTIDAGFRNRYRKVRGVAEIQRRLARVGAYDGPVNGNADDATYTALTDYAGERSLALALWTLNIMVTD